MVRFRPEADILALRQPVAGTRLAMIKELPAQMLDEMQFIERTGKLSTGGQHGPAMRHRLKNQHCKSCAWSAGAELRLRLTKPDAGDY